MIEFFTLNSRYERYELGVYPLEYRTVYGAERFRVGGALARVFFMSVLTIISVKLLNFAPVIEDKLIIVILSASVFIALSTEIDNVIHWSGSNKRYALLTQSGVLVDGIIANISVKEDRGHYYDSKSFEMREYRGTYYIVVSYAFMNARQRVVNGKQIREREDLRDKPLPPIGTAIRVLYADDDTHVML